jgi:peroxiredoxin
LAAFQKALPRLQAEGINVLAASSDGLENARRTVSEWGLTFPVGYGLPVEETAGTLGAFYGMKPEHGRFLHATGFVLKSDRTVLVSVYSSGAIGRLAWQDVLGLVQHLKRGS